jgi:hypothetical protein
VGRLYRNAGCQPAGPPASAGVCSSATICRGCMDTRYVELRRRDGWDAESFARASESYEDWRTWANGVLSKWSDVPHRAVLPKPSYIFGDPVVVEDGRTIRIAIDGDPVTHGALMTIEDALPAFLVAALEANGLTNVEVRYMNRDLEDWKRKNLREERPPAWNFIRRWFRFFSKKRRLTAGGPAG